MKNTRPKPPRPKPPWPKPPMAETTQSRPKLFLAETTRIPPQYVVRCVYTRFQYLPFVLYDCQSRTILDYPIMPIVIIGCIEWREDLRNQQTITHHSCPAVSASNNPANFMYGTYFSLAEIQVVFHLLRHLGIRSAFFNFI